MAARGRGGVGAWTSGLNRSASDPDAAKSVGNGVRLQIQLLHLIDVRSSTRCGETGSLMTTREAKALPRRTAAQDPARPRHRGQRGESLRQ